MNGARIDRSGEWDDVPEWGEHDDREVYQALYEAKEHDVQSEINVSFNEAVKEWLSELNETYEDEEIMFHLMAAGGLARGNLEEDGYTHQGLKLGGATLESKAKNELDTEFSLNTLDEAGEIYKEFYQ